MKRLADITSIAVACLVGTLAVVTAVAFAATPVKPYGTPPPYAKRVDMVGCGPVKIVTVPVNKKVLFVNAGTALRFLHSRDAPMPQWGLAKTRWIELGANGAMTLKFLERHVGCAKTGSYTVNVA